MKCVKQENFADILKYPFVKRYFKVFRKEMSKGVDKSKDT